MPILLALDVWGGFLCHSALTFLFDNQALVEVLNAGTMRDPDVLIILCAITLLALKLDIQICAIHVPGRLDTIADCLSHMQTNTDFLQRLNLNEDPSPLKCSTLKSMQL